MSSDSANVIRAAASFIDAVKANFDIVNDDDGRGHVNPSRTHQWAARLARTKDRRVAVIAAGPFDELAERAENALGEAGPTFGELLRILREIMHQLAFYKGRTDSKPAGFEVYRIARVEQHLVDRFDAELARAHFGGSTDVVSAGQRGDGRDAGSGQLPDRPARPVAKRKRLKSGDAALKIIAALQSLAANGEWDITERGIIQLAGVPKSTYYKVLEREQKVKCARDEFSSRRLGRRPPRAYDD